MNKKIYECYVCGKKQISRKLPHDWHIVTDGRRPKWIGYICKDCNIGVGK